MSEDEDEGDGDGGGTPRAHAPLKLPLVDLSSSSEDDEYEEAESEVEGERSTTSSGANAHDGTPDVSLAQQSRGSVHAIAKSESTQSPEERAEDKESAVATAKEMQGVQSYADEEGGAEGGKGEGGGGGGGGDFKSKMHDLSDKVQKVL